MINDILNLIKNDEKGKLLFNKDLGFIALTRRYFDDFKNKNIEMEQFGTFNLG